MLLRHPLALTFHVRLPKHPAHAASCTPQKKEKEQKEKAGSAYNWNTLFLRQDTVAEVMAEELGVTKGELLSAVRGCGVGQGACWQDVFRCRSNGTAEQSKKSIPTAPDSR